jgi:hypothetical protein
LPQAAELKLIADDVGIELVGQELDIRQGRQLAGDVLSAHAPANSRRSACSGRSRAELCFCWRSFVISAASMSTLVSNCGWASFT